MIILAELYDLQGGRCRLDELDDDGDRLLLVLYKFPLIQSPLIIPKFLILLLSDPIQISPVWTPSVTDMRLATTKMNPTSPTEQLKKHSTH